MIRVSELSDIGQDAGKDAGLSTALKSLARQKENMTPEQIILKLMEIQNGATDPAVKFGASRVAAEVFRSLDSASKSKVLPEVDAILRQTPNLETLARPGAGKVFFEFDEEADAFILPSGRFQTGKAIGLRARELGIPPQELARRQQQSRAAKMAAKRAGRRVKREELRRSVEEGRTPRPSREARPEIPVTPGVAPEATDRQVREAAQRQVEKRVEGEGITVEPIIEEAFQQAQDQTAQVFRTLEIPDTVRNIIPINVRMAGLAQVSADAAVALSEAEQQFRDATVEKKVDILDAATDIRNSLDQQEDGTRTPEQTADDIQDARSDISGGIPTALLIGGAVAVGIGLIFLLK